MENSSPPDNHFSEKNPQLQLAWDSTSLGLLKTCPRKYQLKMIDHWAEKGESLHLDFGIMYHKALEEYDKGKAQGASHEEGVRIAVRRALVDSKSNSWIDPKTHEPSKNKNRETLVRAIVWYLEHFKDDPAQTVILDNGKPAVELSFRMELPFSSSTGEPFLASGHLDRLVEMGGTTYVLDRKTTGSSISSHYYQQFSPGNQISLYTLASRIVLPKSASGVIIDACQLAIGFARFHRGIIHRTPGQLDEWLEDFSRWLVLAEGFASSGHWPQNDTACTMYGGCEYQEICSSDPSMRGRLLEAKFEKRIWNPLETR